MNRLFGMMRYNKQILVVFILSILEICFVLAVAIFDTVQLVLISKSSVNISPAFMPINIALIVVVGISLILILSMFVVKNIKAKRN